MDDLPAAAAANPRKQLYGRTTIFPESFAIYSLAATGLVMQQQHLSQRHQVGTSFAEDVIASGPLDSVSVTESGDLSDGSAPSSTQSWHSHFRIPPPVSLRADRGSGDDSGRAQSSSAGSSSSSQKTQTLRSEDWLEGSPPCRDSSRGCVVGELPMSAAASCGITLI